MYFMVLGHDCKDEGAYERRMAVREAHLKLFQENVEKGLFLYGAGLLDDNEKLTGSMIVCQFESEASLKSNWLDNEPYVTGNVWGDIQIQPVLIPPVLLK